MKKDVLILLLIIVAPVSISAANYLLGERRGDWQTADRSSAGLLPKAPEHPDALIRVYVARTVRWRGIFAVHTWIVVKERGASRYSRYDYTAWGEPIRVDGFAPDGRWFGVVPEFTRDLCTIAHLAGEQLDLRTGNHVQQDVQGRDANLDLSSPRDEAQTDISLESHRMPSRCLPARGMRHYFRNSGYAAS